MTSIIEISMTDARSDLLPALAPHAAGDDQGESVGEIMMEIDRAEGDDGTGMMELDAGSHISMDAVPSPAPVFPKTTENCGPSSDRLPRAANASTDRLHNDAGDTVLTSRNSTKNRQNGVYTKRHIEPWPALTSSTIKERQFYFP